MQPAKLTHNEEQRLSALYETGLLDTPAENAFDSITNITAHLFAMPLSLVCLVDAERVWLKSSKGVEDVNEIQRDIGFCPHTITQKDIFEVKNASTDNRFHDNPLVMNKPNFLYYAGAPLITSDGYALGTLCVMDFQARELSDTQKAQLKDLAATTTALIEARRQAHIQQLAQDYQLGAIVEIAPNEIYLVDTETNKINYANRAAQLNLGCSLDRLKQLSWNEILIESPEELIKSYLQTNRSFFSAPINFEARQKRTDGSTYPVDCQIQASSSSPAEFLIISNDISKRINAQNREKALQTNIVHINRINTASALSSGLAHELNQPLTALSQYCSTALSLLQKKDGTDPLLYDSLEKATAQAFRAGEIVKRFRAFTERRQPTRAAINIQQLVNETIALLSHDIRKHQIRLSSHIADNLPTLNADPIQIQQVLLNLITNSIQATYENQDSQVEVKCTPKDKIFILFSVSDNGPGIDAGLFDNLTMPNTSNKSSGSGLGLSICKFIVNSHEGKMWHDREYTDGTRIHFIIPASTSTNEPH